MLLSILYNSVSYYLFLNLTCVAIIGYGLILTQISRFKPFFEKNILHYFIMGLILISSVSIIVNIFFNLNNVYSFFVIILGIILFIKNYIKIFDSIVSISKYLIITTLFAFIYSYYSGLNDDIAYHYNTILNFKYLNLYEIEHSRQISYNSNWLFLKSIFFLTYFESSIFAISSLLYSITLIDLFSIYKRQSDKKILLISFYSFFYLVFLIGVTNMYKDFGTDMPGVLISVYILLILIYLIISEKKITIDNISYLFLLLSFILMIKITNSLVFFFIFTFLLIIKFKLIKLVNYKFFIVFIPIILWFFQNIVISGCLIWPITPLCFNNSIMSNNELYLIESFAKGDINTKMDIIGFEWIHVWFSNHSTKLLETYLVFIILMCIPLVIFATHKNDSYLKNNITNKLLLCFYFIFPCILCNVIWFFYIPAYRFGIFYNVSLIFFLIFLFWANLQKINLNFYKKYSKILLIISILFFSYENITKVERYIEKYGQNWPPIENTKLIKK